MTSKGKKKLKAIWSVELNREEHDGPAKLPFYEIHIDGKSFLVKYYGVCGIYRANTLEEAKEYIHNQLSEIDKEA